MKLLSLSLFLAAVLASPTSPPIPLVGYADPAPGFNDSSRSTYYNWAGAVDGPLPSGYKFSKASGQFKVQEVFPDGPNDGPWVGVQWVGIGGTGGESLIQAGVIWNVDTQGEKPSGKITSRTYHTWYEWFPNIPLTYTPVAVSAGDEVSVHISLSSASKGTIHVENLSSKKSYTKDLTNTQKPCTAKTAEWIVERPTYPNGYHPFAKFSQASFHNSEATKVGKGKPQTIDPFPNAHPATMIGKNNAVIAVGNIPSKGVVTVDWKSEGD